MSKEFTDSSYNIVPPPHGDNKKWFKLLYFMPIILFLILMNLINDPGGIFSEKHKLYVDKILSGKMTFLGIEIVNARKMKQILIQKMPKNNDVLILGPSLVWGIRKGDTNSEKTFNLGVDQANINDLLAQLALIEINKVNTKKIIFCIDSYLFDKNIYNSFEPSRDLMPYTNYMIKLLNNEPNISPPNLSDIKFARTVTAIKSLFSISYFQSSIKYFFKIIYFNYITKEKVNNGYISAEELNTIDRRKINGPAYDADGSFIYPLKYQNRTLDDVLKDIKDYHFKRKHPGFSINEHMSEFSKDIFEKTVKYYKNKGVKIEFFICPLPPSYWDILPMTNYPILKEEEDFAYYLSNKYDIQITGSINPYKVGIHDADFYDARHVRHEVLSKYFNFKY